MIKENSGNVYRIKLKHDKGYVYSLIRDYSDISDFDGILVQVYTFLDKEKKQDINIEKIIESGIMLGPMPINKYPSKKGKYAWELVGHSDSYD